MPLTQFICPDGIKILVSDCMKEGGCRMSERCATRSYLRMAASDRPWTGRPSTTQLIQGTMCSFLKITKDYAVSPDDRAFMIHGTKGHGRLEAEDDEYSILEEKFNSDDTEVTGIADDLETELNRSILIDYKTSGSYKVQKALGFYVDHEPTGDVYKSGKRKGEPKMRKILKRSDEHVDRYEWEMQLNKYRMEFEKRGMPVDEMRIQCVVRDGNTYIARSRGIFRNIYYFNINKISDDIIDEYFGRKKRALEQAIKSGRHGQHCSRSENWDGLKCQKYCEVAEYCSLGKYLKHEKERESDVINGISQIRRMPRLGKLRLGIKKKAANGKEYPAEIDYFRIDPATPNELEKQKLIDEFHRLYEDKPKQIKIMFPLPDPEKVFPQFYKRYGYGVLKCKGDGVEAGCSTEEDAKGLDIIGASEAGGLKVKCMGRECPYYKAKKCSEHASLSVLLPDMPGAGVWEINTGSYHSIVSINSGLDYVRAMCGRFHMIPLTLERKEQITQYEGKKAKHYILSIGTDFKLAEIQRLAQVDPERMMIAIPEVEPDQEDIAFLENTSVNTVTGEITEAEIMPEEMPPTGPTPEDIAQQMAGECTPVDPDDRGEMPEHGEGQERDPKKYISKAQVGMIHAKCKILSIDPQKIKDKYSVKSMNDLLRSDASKAIDGLIEMEKNK